MRETVDIKYASLFSGIGGFEYGIGQELPEAKCVFSSENEENARRIYRNRFGVMPHGDITKIHARDIPDHDVLTGGFPCQSFSIAGKQRGIEDARGTMFFEIARIAKEKQPYVLFLENVPGLLSNSNGETFQTFLSILDEIGYDVEWCCLNTKTFGGLPQNRERLFIVGYLRRSIPDWIPVFPFIIESEKNDRIKQEKTGKRTWIPCLTTRYGGRWFDEGYIREGRYEYGANSHTIRKLTPEECEKLQGFPPRWTVTGFEENSAKCAKLRRRFVSTYKSMYTRGSITESELYKTSKWVDSLPNNIVPISDTNRYKCIGNAVTTTMISKIFHYIVLNNFKRA